MKPGIKNTPLLLSPNSVIPCNLCRSQQVEVLSLTDRKRRYLRTVICKKCGLIWCDPRPATHDIRHFYATGYRKTYKGSCKPKPKHILRDAYEALRRYDFLAEILRRDDHVLDIGAGSGVFVRVLTELGYSSVTGIEPDEHYAAFAQESLRAEVENSFLQDFQKRNRFRLATMHHVLEHLENPLAALRLIHGLLQPHGCLALEVPNALDMRQDPLNRYHAAHLYTFTPETLEWMGRKAGFALRILHIAPAHGNIMALFQKQESSGMEWDIPTGNDNCARTMEALREYTTLKHFTSRGPYLKFFGSAMKSVAEKIAATAAGEPEEIVRSVVSKRNGWRCPPFIARYYLERS